MTNTNNRTDIYYGLMHRDLGADRLTAGECLYFSLYYNLWSNGVHPAHFAFKDWFGMTDDYQAAMRPRLRKKGYFIKNGRRLVVNRHKFSVDTHKRFTIKMGDCNWRNDKAQNKYSNFMRGLYVMHKSKYNGFVTKSELVNAGIIVRNASCLDFADKKGVVAYSKPPFKLYVWHKHLDKRLEKYPVTDDDTKKVLEYGNADIDTIFSYTGVWRHKIFKILLDAGRIKPVNSNIKETNNDTI